MRFIKSVPVLVLSLIGLSAILPASAEQSMRQCNLARYDLESIIRFDNNAVARGHMICWTPRMSAESKVRHYCGTN